MGVLTAEMQRVIGEQKLAFAATVRADGSPNLSPKGTTCVWDDDHLVFADLASPGTVEALRANPAIELNVVDVRLRRGYRFRGVARLVEGGRLFEDLRAFFNGGSFVDAVPWGDRARLFVLVRVEEAAELVSPSYAVGRTEAEVAAEYETYWARLWGLGAR
jgi:hypothetical protein